ncbi:hypothetical protein CLV92_10556 [Kineococcus xinjiangensis]|uniref:LemA protein n=1 Tax=Kineococcus xinjiangensis TaxID=512762 RepID=A0A2S6INX1_9ACTN|nr:hypothetical protein [Kineococcus xinjiangensis]PPK95957.1 hypothetical protein CLV92_10556 [Kineococcus xinjiangensis]
MTPLLWTLLLLLVCCLLAWYLTATAARLDRLHHRVETSRASLDAELARRASAAVELATSGLLDPATALLLADAATASLDAPRGPGPLDPGPGTREEQERCDEERWWVETALSQALTAALAPGMVDARGRPDAADVVGRARGAVRRVELARRFHNDAVMQARRLRAKRLVRWAHLAGHARLPRTADFDDAAALGRRDTAPDPAPDPAPGSTVVPPGTSPSDRHPDAGPGS